MSVYCKEKPAYLKESIESMLNQSVPTDDFVLVCDGPLTKELDAVIEQYKDFLKIIRLQHNIGLGEALNQGLKHCKHDLVARMDSDDVSDSKRCEEQLNYYRKNPETGLLGAVISEFVENPHEVIGQRKTPLKDTEIKRYSRRRNPFNHPVMMFRKEVIIAAGGYREVFHLFEDYDLWVRVLKMGVCVANLDMPLLYMRTPKNMYQRRGGLNYAKDMLRFRWWMYRIGWSSFIDFLVSAIPQAAVCIMPNFMRKIIYHYLHR